MHKPLIGITIGDLNGIGPEIALKSITTSHIQKLCSPLLIGPIDAYAFYARKLKLSLSFHETETIPAKTPRRGIPVINILPHRAPMISIGKLTEEGGRFSGEAITRAASFCMNGALDGMVTAPVSKEAMALAGYRFPGQTEMLAHLTASKYVAMMLVAEKFRVGLATVHVSIKKVSSTLSKETLARMISVIHKSLQRDFAIRSPRIGILGLNPHAGEHGMIGTEEQEMIIPVIKNFRRKGLHIDGPFPADGFFGLQQHRRYDAVVAMYHDQGLIPLKMSGFHRGVNYSAGLKIIRTSPDHGTAFDIAGRGSADPGSMIEAIKLAAHIALHRRKRQS